MMTKFKKGDQVKCLSNYGDQFTKGKTYVVSSAYGERIQVERDDRGSTTNGWGAYNFELVTGKATIFKVGDRVKCVSNEGSRRGFTVGKSYVVTAVEGAFGGEDGNQLVTCLGDDGREHGQFSNRWELASPELKSGDRVKVVATRWGTEQYGKTGTVYEIGSYGTRPIKVRYDTPLTYNTTTNSYDASDLELLPASKFKVGDKIRGTSADIRGGEYEVVALKPVMHGQSGGMAQTLKTIKGSSNKWGNSEEQVGHVWHRDCDWSSCAELIEPTKFKVGDRVVSTIVPEAGVGIVEAVEDDDEYRVNYKDSWYRVCTDKAKDLELASSEAEKPAAAFNVGDRVRLIRDVDDRGNGKLGTIAKIKESGTILVTIDAPFDGHGFEERQWDVDAKDLEHAPAVTAQQCIVAQVQYGKPRPSTTPFVHATREAAQTEAERLAKKTPGTSFQVYALVSTSVAEVRQVVDAVKTEAA